MTLEEKISQVEDFYALLDKDLSMFQQQSTLSCLSGCSACCRSPHVEATVLEMLPLAFHLYKENKAEDFYTTLLTATSSLCALYTPVQLLPGKGACASYPYRALVCRLFGSSFTRDKEGKSTMLICKSIKEDQPETYQKIEQEAKEENEFPMVVNYHTQLSAIDYYYSQEQHPINEAMRRALEIVLNHFHYRETLAVDEKKVS